jgi:uncharacterized membrane protein
VRGDDRPDMKPRSGASLGRLASAGLALSQRKRLAIGALAGLVAAAASAFVWPWQVVVLNGWDVAALWVLSSVWVFVVALDGDQTRVAASREDLSRATDDVVVLVASVISLVGVMLTLVAAKDESRGLKAVMTTVAVLTVVISWLTVHTIFMLRYARLYYAAPEGGIDFNDESDPDYLDFGYLAFTVGMTFQVSDTDISDSAVRRAITRHALLGYVFGTVIIGVTINVVGGLIQ